MSPFRLLPAGLIAFGLGGCPTPEADDPSVATLAQPIVGGQEADEGEYPWIVSAGGCGGALVGEQWVLSAAHCSRALRVGTRVNIGGHSQNEMDADRQGRWRTIEERICHPDYRGSNNSHDVCLVRLDQPVPVQPIAIDRSSETHTGDLAAVMGWGRLREGGRSPDILNEIEVPVLSNAVCAEAYGRSSIDESMVCAGFMEGGIDACQGDSGGPMVSIDEGTVIGVVSWGHGCARPNKPGVYARVSEVDEWICQITDDEVAGCVPEPTWCDIRTPEDIGDGHCDDDLNNEICNFDGGDCCEETCEDAHFECGSNDFECLDPYVVDP